MKDIDLNANPRAGMMDAALDYYYGVKSIRDNGLIQHQHQLALGHVKDGLPEWEAAEQARAQVQHLRLIFNGQMRNREAALQLRAQKRGDRAPFKLGGRPKLA